MTRVARLLATIGLLLAGAQAWGVTDGEAFSGVGMGPDIRMHKPPAEPALRIGATYSDYLGPVAESDIYGGFADVDGDGRKDLLIVVDNDLTCDENVCDFFIFAPVVKDRQVVTACDWHVVDDRREPITRGVDERLVNIGGHSVVLTTLPQEMPCTLCGDDWLTYFHFVYRYARDTGSQKLRCAALSDSRPATSSVGGDMAE